MGLEFVSLYSAVVQDGSMNAPTRRILLSKKHLRVSSIHLPDFGLSSLTDSVLVDFKPKSSSPPQKKTKHQQHNNQETNTNTPNWAHFPALIF